MKTALIYKWSVVDDIGIFFGNELFYARGFFGHKDRADLKVLYDDAFNQCISEKIESDSIRRMEEDLRICKNNQLTEEIKESYVIDCCTRGFGISYGFAVQLNIGETFEIDCLEPLNPLTILFKKLNDKRLVCAVIGKQWFSEGIKLELALICNSYIIDESEQFLFRGRCVR